jgi:hypothetical protein
MTVPLCALALLYERISVVEREEGEYSKRAHKTKKALKVNFVENCGRISFTSPVTRARDFSVAFFPVPTLGSLFA